MGVAQFDGTKNIMKTFFYFGNFFFFFFFWGGCVCVCVWEEHLCNRGRGGK